MFEDPLFLLDFNGCPFVNPFEKQNEFITLSFFQRLHCGCGMALALLTFDFGPQSVGLDCWGLGLGQWGQVLTALTLALTVLALLTLVQLRRVCSNNVANGILYHDTSSPVPMQHWFRAECVRAAGQMVVMNTGNETLQVEWRPFCWCFAVSSFLQGCHLVP